MFQYWKIWGTNILWCPKCSLPCHISALNTKRGTFVPASQKVPTCNKCSLKVTIHSPLGCICAPESNCIGTFATEKGTYVTWREHLQHFEKQCVPNVPPMSHLCPLPSLSFFLLSLSPSLSPKLIKCNKCSLKVTIHSPLGHIWLESWNHWSWKPIRSEL